MSGTEKWIVVVTSAEYVTAYFGIFRSHGRARALQLKLNEAFAKEEGVGAWARLELVETSPGIREIVSWALNTNEEDNDE